MKTKEQSETDNAIDRMVEKAKKQGRKEGIAEVFKELEKRAMEDSDENTIFLNSDVNEIKKKFMGDKA